MRCWRATVRAPATSAAIVRTLASDGRTLRRNLQVTTRDVLHHHRQVLRGLDDIVDLHHLLGSAYWPPVGLWRSRQGFERRAPGRQRIDFDGDPPMQAFIVAQINRALAAAIDQSQDSVGTDPGIRGHSGGRRSGQAVQYRLNTTPAPNPAAGNAGCSTTPSDPGGGAGDPSCRASGHAQLGLWHLPCQVMARRLVHTPVHRLGARRRAGAPRSPPYSYFGSSARSNSASSISRSRRAARCRALPGHAAIAINRLQRDPDRLRHRDATGRCDHDCWLYLPVRAHCLRPAVPEAKNKPAQRLSPGPRHWRRAAVRCAPAPDS